MSRLDTETAVQEVDTIVKLALAGDMLKAAEYLDRLLSEQYEAGYGQAEVDTYPLSDQPPRRRRRSSFRRDDGDTA